MRVDSFTPAHSAFGLPIYVAPLPAGSIQRVCNDTLVVLPSMSVNPPLPFARLTHSRRKVTQRLPWLISFSLDRKAMRILLLFATLALVNACGSVDTAELFTGVRASDQTEIRAAARAITNSPIMGW
jgi:hypothetical protein